MGLIPIFSNKEKALVMSRVGVIRKLCLSGKRVFNAGESMSSPSHRVKAKSPLASVVPASRRTPRS